MEKITYTTEFDADNFTILLDVLSDIVKHNLSDTEYLYLDLITDKKTVMIRRMNTLNKGFEIISHISLFAYNISDFYYNKSYSNKPAKLDKAKKTLTSMIMSKLFG